MAKNEKAVIPVDQGAFEFLLCVNIKPEMEWGKNGEEAKQKTDRRGLPVWVVSVQAVEKSTDDDFSFKVKVPSAEKPAVKRLAIVEFENLTARPWAIIGDDGKLKNQGIAYAADAVKALRRQ